MYSNVIFIELYNKDKIETLLHRWIKEYRESIDKNIEFQIIRDKEGKFIVKIDGIISNYHFYFLVNFCPLMIYVDNKSLTYNNDVENVKLKK